MLGLPPSDNTRLQRLPIICELFQNGGFWSACKYELFNLDGDSTLVTIEQGFKVWIHYYNCARLLAALGNTPPEEREKSISQQLPPQPGNLFAFCRSFFRCAPVVNSAAQPAHATLQNRKKLGLTINAKTSNLTPVPRIGFRCSLNAFTDGQKTGYPQINH